MNVQSAPPPYSPAGASNTTQGGYPPVLGAQVPGSAGGLPALSGLRVTDNPVSSEFQSQEQGGPAQMQLPGVPPQQAAQQVQNYGRGEDSMLVHMTPNEVNSLRGLAQRFGGDLTTNPNTGLPEAGWLGKLLPTILGVAGAAFGIPTWAIGLGVGAGKTAVTGDLSKGLMAGLQAFGGAGLGQAAGLGGELGSIGADLGLTQSATGAASGAAGAGTSGLLPTGGVLPTGVAPTGGTATLMGGVGEAGGTALTKSPGFLSKFAAETSLGQKGLLGSALPAAAGASMLGAVSDATAPQMPKYEEEKSNYVPMGPGKREVRFQSPDEMRRTGGAEFQYFTPTNPEPIPLYGETPGFAEGGVATPPNRGNFDDLVRYFGSTSPGPITATMYPSSVPIGSGGSAPVTPSPTAPPVMGGGEVLHDFNRNPAPPAGGLAGLSGLGGFPSGAFGPVIEQIISRTSQPAPRASQRSRSRGPTLGRGSIDRTGTLPRYEAFAEGGPVNMRDGSFVVDARTVSELGNGSSNAGIELLSKMGGRPVHGPGDGVSDSVKASIGGSQEARVARDEVIFQPEAVRRLGGGNEARGTQKLYALMDKAHKARKKAKRGQDTGVRRGLA